MQLRMYAASDMKAIWTLPTTESDHWKMTHKFYLYTVYIT